MLLLIGLLALVLVLVLYYHKVYIRFSKDVKNCTPVSIFQDNVAVMSFQLKHFLQNVNRILKTYPGEILTKFFVDKAMKNLEEAKESGRYTNGTEKPILEKMLDVDVQVAHIMASDMLLGGGDTVTIVIPHQYMSGLEEHYPKPDEFIPERWLVEKNDPFYHGNTNPFVTAPFGFGARMCIGRRIAELEMETMITKVVKNFQIGWDGPPPNLKPASALNYVTGPFYFIFKDL